MGHLIISANAPANGATALSRRFVNNIVRGLKMKHERKAWGVYTNTDLTEGRGRQFLLHICDLKATAIRLASKAGVMGSDAKVTQVNLIKVGDEFYGPVYIKSPTTEDEDQQKRINAREAATDKAIAAGLSEADIRLLRL